MGSGGGVGGGAAWNNSPGRVVEAGTRRGFREQADTVLGAI